MSNFLTGFVNIFEGLMGMKRWLFDKMEYSIDHLKGLDQQHLQYKSSSFKLHSPSKYLEMRSSVFLPLED